MRNLRIFISLIFLLGGMAYILAQPALYNSGNIRIHDQGQLGFHTDLINDSAFDDNLGLAGFYGLNQISVSGAFAPVFYDLEIANNNGVFMNTSINVLNNTNFIIGDFITPRDLSGTYLNFLEDSFYNGDRDISKVDGYAAVTNRQNFTFPVGDAGQLRSLILNSESVNIIAKCAYFFEDPNSPSAFPGFNTEIKPQTIAAVSTVEFWRLEGEVNGTISLLWNARSNISAIAEEVGMVTLMGWSKTLNRWQSIGNTAVGGDLSNGFITSAPFIPNDYEIITFGSLAEPEDILTLDNYLLTPNGDGINDFLVIPELDQSPNNSLQIFDRNGIKVFEQINYTNEFGGVANVGDFIINREQGLPEGVYFYVISLIDLSLNYQGFLYLDR